MKGRKIPCEVYSRVVGYYRPVSQWNRAKREEFEDRHQYKPEEILQCIGAINKPERGDLNV